MSFQLSNGISDLNKITETYQNSAILLDFHAKWCGPCKRIAPGLDALARSSKTVLVKVDIDEPGNKDLVDSLKPRAVPTFVWIVKGKVVRRLEGGDLELVTKTNQSVLANL